MLPSRRIDHQCLPRSTKTCNCIFARFEGKAPFEVVERAGRMGSAQNGVILCDVALKHERVTHDKVLAAVRSEGYADLADVLGGNKICEPFASGCGASLYERSYGID